MFDALDRVQGESLALRMFSMHVFDHDRAARRACPQALLELLGSGAIRPPIHERVPLAETARAQRLLESGAVWGT